MGLSPKDFEKKQIRISQANNELPKTNAKLGSNELYEHIRKIAMSRQ